MCAAGDEADRLVQREGVMETKILDLADPDDGLIREELHRFADTPSICLEQDFAGHTSVEARQRSSDVRGISERHGTPLLVDRGDVAVAQYTHRSEGNVSSSIASERSAMPKIVERWRWYTPQVGQPGTR